MLPNLSRHFPQYTEYDPLVPVWCATPGEGRTIHRFFDTSPFSPSGRFLALTRLPYEDRLPKPGDVAEVVLVDLETGEEKVVAETKGWDTQLGAQVQWGAADNQLFFNDVDTSTWQAYGVRFDPASGETKKLDGPVYMVSEDGLWAASPCLLRTGATQAGYGVVVPPEYVPRNEGAPADDGVFITNTVTGESRLLVSLKEIVEATQPLDPASHPGGAYYGAHVKWNPQGTRLMLVLRWLPGEGTAGMERIVITMDADASNIKVSMPADRWKNGGHHPNWCPDGETVMMNLNVPGDAMRFVRVRYDGADYHVMTDAVLGSGHPTLHPDGRHILTDAYPNEPLAFSDDTVPIRMVDIGTGHEDKVVRIKTVPPYRGPAGELRVDPHPAWDKGFRRIAFNACPEGTRQVYVADLSAVL